MTSKTEVLVPSQEEQTVVNKKEGKPKFEEKTVIAQPAKRYFALLLDYTIIMIFLQGLGPIFAVQNWDLLSTNEMLTSLIPLYIIGIGIFIAKDIFSGRSIGKRLLNLHVSLLDPPKFTIPATFKLLTRNLFLIILPVEGIMMLIDKYCRRLGDKYTDTLVVEEILTPNVRRLSTKVIGIILIVATLWIISIATVPIKIKKSLAYQVALTAVQEDSEIRKITGKIVEFSYWPGMRQKNNDTFITVKVFGEKKVIDAEIIVKRTGNQMKVALLNILDEKKQEKEKEKKK
ncbi:MAG: putative RDD family membrane protein YckC [bacterium]|jgi:uncharacterized RDD family membrane protein YckC